MYNVKLDNSNSSNGLSKLSSPAPAPLAEVSLILVPHPHNQQWCQCIQSRTRTISGGVIVSSPAPAQLAVVSMYLVPHRTISGGVNVSSLPTAPLAEVSMYPSFPLSFQADTHHTLGSKSNSLRRDWKYEQKSGATRRSSEKGCGQQTVQRVIFVWWTFSYCRASYEN